MANELKTLQTERKNLSENVTEADTKYTELKKEAKDSRKASVLYIGSPHIGREIRFCARETKNKEEAGRKGAAARPPGKEKGKTTA